MTQIYCKSYESCDAETDPSLHGCKTILEYISVIVFDFNMLFIGDISRILPYVSI